MSVTTSKPYDWLRQIPRSLLQLDDVPLFGSTLPFPWNELGQTLGIDLGIEGLQIEAADAQWVEQQHLFENLGDNLVPLNIGISGLGGSLCWIMPKDELDYMISKLLDINGERIDLEFEESFYRFLGYQVIHTIGRINWDKNLAVHILNSKELPAEASFCIDIKASWNEHTLRGRLIIAPTFQKAWKERFSERSLEYPALTTSLSDKVEINVHLTAGGASFSPGEWEQVKQGDFVLLDSCTIDASGKGNVNLCVKGIPFFTGSLENGAVKILKHPDFREVDATMANDTPDDEEFDEDFEDFEDEDLDEEENEESSDDLEKEDVGEELEEEEPISSEESKVDATLAAEKSPLASPKEIPMAVVVEVGRIKISLQKLMELQPGNLLDLHINPEDGVDLTVNGKRVAKAELLRVGETLGVRILDIG